MLEFSPKTYRKILDIAVRHNIIANCREYPSLLLNAKKTSLRKIRRVLQKNIKNRDFKCGLYVHFPFCASRCSFCKYYSELMADERQAEDFLQAFGKEIGMYKMDFKKIKMENLFLGGGTPTMLDRANMKKFLDIIYANFNFKENAQRTIEGTPESLTPDKVKLYAEYGIGRISIGLQSANDDVLKNIGRRHTVKDVFSAFDTARKGGINHIATELIWGLPGETKASYRKTIKDIIALAPDFIEGYLLTEGGRVGIKKQRPADSSLDSVIKMSKEMLLSRGYRVYYSSNFLGFIKNGITRAEAMNQNTDGLYSYDSDVLGIGTGASSHFHNYKYKIISDFESYRRYLANGSFPGLHGMDISADDYKRHYVILQIGFYRLINKKRFREIFGSDFYDNFPEEIDCLRRKNVITEDEDNYKWRLGDHEMGHRSFFIHVIQYWYNQKYIKQILKKCS